MNSCERYELLISLAVDGEATPEERARLKRHLESCPDCRAYYADIQRIHRAFIREDAVVPEDFSRRLMDRVRETRQDPIREDKKKIIRFPHWRRWGALAACCALTALCVWCVWETGGRNVITKDDARESLDMRSMDSGFQAARSVDSVDLIEDEDVELVLADLDDEAPLPGPDDFAVSIEPATKASAEKKVNQLQPDLPSAVSVPEEDGVANADVSYYRRDGRMDEPQEEVGVFFTEYEAEQESGAGKAPEVPAAVHAYIVEPEPEKAEPSEVANVPEPGIVTAFGSAAQSWVEDVLGAPWAGGGSYPLTAEQYSDLLRTLDEAGEPYRLEPGDGYCLLTE